MDSIRTEIETAMKFLGYRGMELVGVKNIAEHRYRVTYSGMFVGIYDIDSHTFIAF